METIWMIQKTAAGGNWWSAASSQQHAHSCIMCCIVFLVKHQVTQATLLPYSPDLVPWDFWLFPKLKSPLKWKRFQTINDIHKNTMGKLMVIRRTVWGPKVPTLKGAEASLSCVQCFLYLVSSSINACIFYITWPDVFWTDLVCAIPKNTRGEVGWIV